MDIRENKTGNLFITRVLHAPRAVVWQVWTQPEHVKHWWGPKGFTAPSVDIDFREGGHYLYAMRWPEDVNPPDQTPRDNWSTGVYREIVAPERIVVTDSFADEHGNVVPASHYGLSDDFPLESEVIVTFEDLGPNTKLTLAYPTFPGGKDGEDARQGWNESLDKLEHYVRSISSRDGGETLFVAEPGKPEIVMTRIFNAPPERVFEAMVNPHHIPEWWGPRKMTTIIEQADVREGGRWWFTQHNRQGDVHTFYGEYRELTYPDRLVQTVNVEGLPEDHEVVETITFEPRLGGRSLVTARSVYKSVRDRDYELAAGGEKNAVESWDRLDKFLWRTREAKAA